MTPMEKVLIEVEISFNLFVSVILHEFHEERQKNVIDQLMAASSIDDGDLSNLKRAIERTSRWIKDYQYNSPGTPSSLITDARRSIEQLGSIIHIGRAYPEKAIARATKLRPTFIPKKKQKTVIVEENEND